MVVAEPERSLLARVTASTMPGGPNRLSDAISIVRFSRRGFGQKQRDRIGQAARLITLNLTCKRLPANRDRKLRERSREWIYQPRERTAPSAR
ncbi:MAG: hypothetical protein QOJ64_1485 [Acidobacteriota bacterium]|nr:hypothetical protein [Acidobacteriota bacterium]